MRESEVRSLVGFETASDGTAVKLFAEDVAGRETAISMGIETLTALLVTTTEDGFQCHQALAERSPNPDSRCADRLPHGSESGPPPNPPVPDAGRLHDPFSLSEQLSERMGRAHPRTDG
jgi:hypothetical protein